MCCLPAFILSFDGHWGASTKSTKLSIHKFNERERLLDTRNNISMCLLNNNETFCTMHYNRMRYHFDSIQSHERGHTKTRAHSMQKHNNNNGSNAAKCCNYWGLISLYTIIAGYTVIIINSRERNEQIHIQAHGCSYSHIWRITHMTKLS